MIRNAITTLATIAKTTVSTLSLILWGIIAILFSVISFLVGILLIFGVPLAAFKLIELGEQTYPEWGWLFFWAKVALVLTILLALGCLNPDSSKGGDGTSSGHNAGARRAQKYIKWSFIHSFK